jgi:quercetin dioxygenase-like cupin family protein
MSLPSGSGPYALGPDEGEALWFNGALGILRATAAQTDGRFAAFELRPPKGFGAPLHVHEGDYEFFIVLSGEFRLRYNETVLEATPGSLVYTPPGIGHSFTADSDNARILLFFGPAGPEEFFREVATPAKALTLPPPDEPRPSMDEIIGIMKRHGQTILGPPLPPKG